MTQVGTPMWMAPEIIQGRQYTQKADVYAFGIILWEILTRLEPYEDKEPMQIVLEVVNQQLRPHAAGGAEGVTAGGADGGLLGSRSPASGPASIRCVLRLERNTGGRRRRSGLGRG